MSQPGRPELGLVEGKREVQGLPEETKRKEKNVTCLWGSNSTMLRNRGKKKKERSSR